MLLENAALPVTQYKYTSVVFTATPEMCLFPWIATCHFPCTGRRRLPGTCRELHCRHACRQQDIAPPTLMAICSGSVSLAVMASRGSDSGTSLLPSWNELNLTVTGAPAGAPAGA